MLHLSYGKAFINGVFQGTNIMHYSENIIQIINFTCYFLDVYNI